MISMILGGFRVETFFANLMDGRQVGLTDGRGLRSKRNYRQEQSKNYRNTRMLTHSSPPYCVSMMPVSVWSRHRIPLAWDVTAGEEIAFHLAGL